MEVKLTVFTVVSCVTRLTLTDVAIRYSHTRSSVCTRTTFTVADFYEHNEFIMTILLEMKIMTIKTPEGQSYEIESKAT